MQKLDFDKFSNTAGWRVIHDPDNNMYKIKSEKGHELRGVYTARRLAEVALYNYLDKITKEAQKQQEKKK